ncbi:MAG: cell division protein [Phycisphaeraceae bacterium]|nr:MAG: cell division protein [Phycisphaeraceae bacterium]
MTAPRSIPRSTIVVGALTLVVFALVGVIASCSLNAPRAGGSALAPRPTEEPAIRVRVHARTTLATITLRPAYEGAQATGVLGLRWTTPGGSPGADAIAVPAEVTIEGGSVVLRAPSGETFGHAPGRALTIAPPAGGTLMLDGAAIPGTFTIEPRRESTDAGAGVFDVIAEMSVENYLPGVVAKELYPSWPLATFQAQAICARSYALHERARARRAGRSYDVESTTQDQVFGGATDLAVAHDAVTSTRGQVLTYRGEVLRAYYSSTSGGRAASAADTWPTGPGYEFNTLAPLQAAPREYADEASPAHRWERQRRTARLSLRLRRYGEENGKSVKNIGTIAVIAPTSHNAVGRPTRYTVRDNHGREFVLKAEELRLACNWPVPGVPDITAKQRVRSGDLTARVEGDVTVIEGRGFGHGVGLCQYSAAGFAAKGWAYRDIVLHFYPGAELERIYR